MLSQSARLAKQSSAQSFGRLAQAVRLIVAALNIFAGRLKFECATHDGKAILFIVRRAIEERRRPSALRFGVRSVLATSDTSSNEAYCGSRIVHCNQLCSWALHFTTRALLLHWNAARARSHGYRDLNDRFRLTGVCNSLGESRTADVERGGGNLRRANKIR